MAFTSTPTAKYLLRKITGSSDRSEIDDGIGALADDIDANMAGYAEGTLTARPGAGKAGRFYRTTDTGQWFGDTGSAWDEIGVSPWRPGDLKASWLTVAPAGWLICDGSAVSRATYATLYAAIGDSAGAGNGSTTFNVPDFRGRVFVHPDGSAGRMADNDARSQSGGAATVTLDTTMIPAHSHGPGNGTLFVNSTVGASNLDSGPGAKIDASLASATTASVGGGLAHENRMPFLVGGAVMIKV